MTEFSQFNLPPALMENLQRMEYKTPTPIQAQTIPLGLAGRDILGSAQTGTGKTAAFGIPLVNKLLSSPRGVALVLLPTRELAVQVRDVVTKLLHGNRMISTALVIGGESMTAQINQLRRRPRVIVGTPGRINDHLERGTLMLHDVNYLVLDETDRMLDMGFAIQLEKIFKFLPAQRQTMMFSATMPDNITRMAARFLNNPERIAVGSTTATASKVTQEVIHTTAPEKYDLLIDQLSKREGSVIIFVKTKYGADKLAIKLNKAKHSAEAIHGDLQQRARDRVLRAFREKQFRILVATDIAARGLDVPHIEHVINFDLPQCPEDYIHRIGRTGRAGAEGQSVNLVAPEDHVKWRAIQKMLNPNDPALSQRPQGSRGNGGGNNAGNGNNNGAPMGKRRGKGPRQFQGPRQEGGRDGNNANGNGAPGKRRPFRFKKRNGGNAGGSKPASAA